MRVASVLPFHFAKITPERFVYGEWKIFIQKGAEILVTTIETTTAATSA